MKTTWQKIKKFFLHFFTLEDTPHKIAAGFALGIFLGIIPSVGPLTVLFVTSFLGLNRAAGLIGALTTNMWGTIAAMSMAAIVGGFLFNTTPALLVQQFEQTYHLGYRYFLSTVIFFDLALPMLVGFILVAGTISLAAYFLLYFILKYKK